MDPLVGCKCSVFSEYTNVFTSGKFIELHTYAHFSLKRKQFLKAPSHLPPQPFVLPTFRSQDAFDLLQERLVHKSWWWATHSQCWVLAVDIKHDDIVVGPSWEKRSNQVFV